MKRIYPETDIYAILDLNLSRGRSNVEITKRLLEAEVKIIQYREKDRKLGVMLEECRAIRELTRAAGATFIVNDFTDIALLADADGIHVGQEDIPLPELRKLVGPERIIGLSTHSPEQARAAVAAGADYIGVGPIFHTNTKKDAVDPVGFEYLDYVAKNIKLPFAAIGGIKEHNIGAVAAHGARCCCIISAIVGADDVAGAVRNLRRAMREGRK
ncbi:MAG: thiamine phosphate synthase [Deltaproteobacteria bacterium]|jgi:thiamine-phosphate pyrophosphorylase|nr:thiamine phosphate synthase [Deltaproteobacteria bacterium]